MLANQICMLYTSKSCPIVGELASSPVEGRKSEETWKNKVLKESLGTFF